VGTALSVGLYGRTGDTGDIGDRGDKRRERYHCVDRRTFNLQDSPNLSVKPHGPRETLGIAFDKSPSASSRFSRSSATGNGLAQSRHTRETAAYDASGTRYRY
jgi:hypothetical protein